MRITTGNRVLYGRNRGTGKQMHHGTNKGADGGKKRYGKTAVLLTLALSLCTVAPAVRAQGTQAEGAGQETSLQAAAPEQTAGSKLYSKGSLVYRDGEKGTQIYSADLLILRDKLDTIPDMIFEPACYAHIHRWEYRDVNGETHTRHCESCGDAFDLVSVHRAERIEDCTISYGGAEYPGIRYTCACGYQWEREAAHTLIFEAVDEVCHRSKCCLEGTPYCPGYEPVTEEHYAYHYIPCEDGCHHERICMDCGYRDVEECRFTLTDADGGKDENGEGESDEKKDSEEISGGENGSRRCWCGNVEKTAAENGEGSSDKGRGADPSGTTSVESPSRTESGEGSSDTENWEVTPGEKNPDAEPETPIDGAQETLDTEAEN